MYYNADMVPKSKLEEIPTVCGAYKELSGTPYENGEEWRKYG